ncbi:MAG: hypothetical protein V1725_07215 [archaeon]
MDLQRKVELMQRYDFPGYINCLSVISMKIQLWADFPTTGKTGEQYVSKLNEATKKLQTWYGTIDFACIEQEMNSVDEDDFATLFLTRAALPTLVETVDAFVTYARTHEYHVSRKDEPYIAVQQAVQRLIAADKHEGIPYRTRVRRRARELTACTCPPKPL